MSVTITVPAFYNYAPRMIEDGNLRLALEVVARLPKTARPAIRAVKDFGNRASRSGALSCRLSFIINPRARNLLNRIEGVLLYSAVGGYMIPDRSRVLDMPHTYVEFEFPDGDSAMIFRLSYTGKVL